MLALFDDKKGIPQNVAIWVHNFLSEFQQLIDAARSLSKIVGGEVLSSANAERQQSLYPGLVHLWDRIDWIWTQAEKMEMLIDMQREFAAVQSLLKQNENRQVLHTGKGPRHPIVGGGLCPLVASTVPCSLCRHMIRTGGTVS